MEANKPVVGKPISRLEGVLKVTGKARYAAEFPAPDLLYAYVVNSTITKGKIEGIDTQKARAVQGVVDILTHENRPALAAFDIQYADMDSPPGTVFKPLYDAKIRYNGQPIALVIAEDFETARYAASLVEVRYKTEAFDTCLEDNLSRARKPKAGLITPAKPGPPKPQGDFEKAYHEAPFKTDRGFRHSAEHHNPMELFATTTIWAEGDKLTIYDKTQGTINNQVFIANAFGLPFKDVRVIAPFVGGAFGSGLRPQYQLFLCVMAALHLKRNVRLMLSRKQMFTFGHRPQSIQRLRFSANADGKVNALAHHTISETSRFEDYTEKVSQWSHMLYPAPNTLFEYKIAPLDLYTPIDMRAPGGVTALHAIECTMDELAYAAGLDPVEFRLRNYSETDPATQKPFTSKALRECYQLGAERFGWAGRNPVPGSMTRGNKLVGWGMATGIWDAMQFPARAEARINAEGKLIVRNAVTDIGTGTLTVMTQVAADALGLPIEDVSFRYGDSKQPFSMFEGGSSMAASTSSAILAAARALRDILFRKAKSIPGSPLAKAKAEEVIFENGEIRLKKDPSQKVSFREIVAANGGRSISVKKLSTPQALKLRKYAKGTHSAAFVEVEVDQELKTIAVTRAVTAVAAGKIINPKTAGSQILGGMVWGISKALREHSMLDENLGKFINANLAEYHIPVHADIGDLQVIFADEKDALINELGVKGVGEIGIVAMPAAIANAIFHATGKRLANLPIHFDQLL